MSSIQKLAWRHFTKKHSLSLRPEVVELLEEKLSIIPKDQIGQVIEYIATAYMKYGKGTVVEMEMLEEIIKKLFRSHKVQTESVCPKDYVHLVSNSPMLSYEPHLAQFYLEEFPEVQHRMLMVLERVQRYCHEQGLDRKICPIKGIKTREQTVDNHTFGMLYKRSENQSYSLEDMEDIIKVEFKEGVLKGQNLVNGQFVVVHVDISKKSFVVDDILPVPLEPRRSFLKLPGAPCPLKSIAKETEPAKSLRELERKCTDAYLLCFAELWLDQDGCLGDFEDILRATEESENVPSIIVLLGCFHSNSPTLYGKKSANKAYDEYRQLFSKLAGVIAKFPKIVHDCKIVIAPGPSGHVQPLDPFSPPNVMPRFSFPKELFVGFQKANIQVLISDDPVRLFWFSRELVFSRDELSGRMEKARLGGTEPFDTMKSAEIALAQGTTQPFISSVQPIRSMGHGSISLVPQPDLLVIAEKGGVTGNIQETLIGNPDRFSYTRTFLKYTLFDNSLQFCSK